MNTDKLQEAIEEHSPEEHACCVTKHCKGDGTVFVCYTLICVKPKGKVSYCCVSICGLTCSLESVLANIIASCKHSFLAAFVHTTVNLSLVSVVGKKKV